MGYLNVTESGATCPTGLTKHQYINTDHEVCGWTNSPGASFASTIFLTLGVCYDKVCGQVRVYQYASFDAFEFRSNVNINTPYVDGVLSLMDKMPIHTYGLTLVKQTHSTVLTYYINNNRRCGSCIIALIHTHTHTLFHIVINIVCEYIL